MILFVPSSLTASSGVSQLVVVRSMFCCGLQPVEDEGQVMTTVFVAVLDTFSDCGGDASGGDTYIFPFSAAAMRLLPSAEHVTEFQWAMDALGVQSVPELFET